MSVWNPAMPSASRSPNKLAFAPTSYDLVFCGFSESRIARFVAVFVVGNALSSRPSPSRLFGGVAAVA